MRRRNFSDDELRTLIEECIKHKSSLFGKHSSTQTAKDKSTAWAQVTEAVNSVSHTVRTTEEIRRKFSDFKSVTKNKEAKRRREAQKTG